MGDYERERRERRDRRERDMNKTADNVETKRSEKDVEKEQAAIKVFVAHSKF